MFLSPMETVRHEPSFHTCEKTIKRPLRISPNQQKKQLLRCSQESTSKHTVESIAQIFRTYALRSSSRNLFTNIKLSTVEAFLRYDNFCMTDGEIYKSIGLCLPHTVRHSKIDVRSAMEQILIEGSVARQGLYPIKSPAGTDIGAIKLWNLNPECIADCLRIAFLQIQRTDANLAQKCKQHVQSVSNSEELLDPILMEDVTAYVLCRMIEFVGKVSSLNTCLHAIASKMPEDDFLGILKPFPPEEWTTTFISSINSGVLTPQWLDKDISTGISHSQSDLSETECLNVVSVI